MKMYQAWVGLKVICADLQWIYLQQKYCLHFKQIWIASAVLLWQAFFQFTELGTEIYPFSSRTRTDKPAWFLFCLKVLFSTITSENAHYPNEVWAEISEPTFCNSIKQKCLELDVLQVLPKSLVDNWVVIYHCNQTVSTNWPYVQFVMSQTTSPALTPQKCL